MRDILVEIDARKVVDGREDMIARIVLDFTRARPQEEITV